MGKGKYRISRISFCEWNSESNGNYNTGGFICGSCNYHRTRLRGENYSNYQNNNKIDRNHNCPQCKDKNWYYLPPIARIPKKKLLNLFGINFGKI